MIQKKIDQHIASLNDLDEETKLHNNQILRTIQKAGASYIGELAWENSLTEYQVKLCLRDLKDKKLVEIVHVHPTSPDRRLLARVPDQSMRGQAGYHNFAKKRWFALTEEGVKAVGSVLD